MAEADSRKPLVITITADSSYVVYDKTMDANALKDLLKKSAASYESVDIRAHPGATVGTIRSAVAHAQAAGFEEITMFGPLFTVSAGVPAQNQRPVRNPRPVVVSSVPSIGATAVPPDTRELRITFDQDMTPNSRFAFGAGGFRDFDFECAWIDPRTAVIDIRPQIGRNCILQFNRERSLEKGWEGFRSTSGVPAMPTTIWFVTAGADGTPRADLQPPRIVTLDPPNESINVSPDIAELVVRFDREMQDGAAWTDPEGKLPELTGKPHWDDDKITCVLPVKLLPGREYVLSLNDAWYIDFASSAGVPLVPQRYSFTTASR
jgi:hypothetical protein